MAKKILVSEEAAKKMSEFLQSLGLEEPASAEELCFMFSPSKLVETEQKIRTTLNEEEQISSLFRKDLNKLLKEVVNAIEISKEENSY